MEQAQDILQVIIGTLATGIITFLSVSAKKLISKGFDFLESKVHSEQLLQILHHSEEAVLHSYQTIMISAKKKLKDGKIDDAEYAELKRQAKEEAKNLLRKSIASIPNIASHLIGDKLDEYIESAIPKVKKKSLPINPN